MKEYILDLKGKSFGRAASEAAALLRGKKEPDFTPNQLPAIQVKIVNLPEVKITGSKMKQKTYKRYSGYPGGFKIVAFEKIFKQDPQRAFRMAVYRMLPKNKLRDRMIKNLVFK